MSANIKSFVRLSGTTAPWWGDNHNTLDATASIEQWLAASGLDYKVQLRKLYMRSAPGAIPEIEIPYYAVTNSKDGTIFQVASTGYKPIQNDQIVAIMRTYAEAGEMSIDTMGSLGNGAVVWALAKVPGASFKLSDGDESETYLLMATSHDGTLAYSGQITSVRVVCQNTLRLAMSDKSGKLFKLKHTKNADIHGTHADVVKKIEAARIATRDMEMTANLLGATKIDADTRDDIIYQLTQPTLYGTVAKQVAEQAQIDAGNSSVLDRLIYESESTAMAQRLRNEADHNKAGRAILDALIHAPGADMPKSQGTAWGLLNAVTYYTDHVAGSDKTTNQDRLQSQWFGHYGELKDKALELVVQASEARH